VFLAIAAGDQRFAFRVTDPSHTAVGEGKGLYVRCALLYPR
jgi:hypothetical protein